MIFSWLFCASCDESDPDSAHSRLFTNEDHPINGSKTRSPPITTISRLYTMVILRKTNPLSQLLSSTTKSCNKNEGSSGVGYLILIQHSHSFEKRQAASTTTITDDNEIYQRARVRTPQERAQRDLIGSSGKWIQRIAKDVGSVDGGGGVVVLWIQTCSTIQPPPSCSHVLNISKDPLGWAGTSSSSENKEGQQDTTNTTPSMTNLESLLVAIQRYNPQMILMDTLHPLLILHGMARVVLWLQRLLQSGNPLVVVPLLQECLSPEHHRVLEDDVANAVLYLDQGEAVLIRQGVRERANVLREAVPFEIGGDTNEIVLLNADDASSDESTKKKKTDKDEVINDDDPVVATTASRVGKITLQHESDDDRGRTTTASSEEQQQRPRIYIQDDDPEYDDMDEEDPDDDLDI